MTHYLGERKGSDITVYTSHRKLRVAYRIARKMTQEHPGRQFVALNADMTEITDRQYALARAIEGDDNG